MPLSSSSSGAARGGATPSGGRPQHYRFHQGERVLPFDGSEYDARLAALRSHMAGAGIEAAVFTSVTNVAYYSGFLYCAFGRAYALVVTPTQSVTISAAIDAARPWRRSHGDALSYTDWQPGNVWRAILSVTGLGKTLGYEADHLTVAARMQMREMLQPARMVDLAAPTMARRIVKSEAEIALIRATAAVADEGAVAVRAAIGPGAREIDVAIAGRDAMERAIARRWPEAEHRDTAVWFQSGPNTDGARNPRTARGLAQGDILGLCAFPVVAGYGVPLGRTLFCGAVDDASRAVWEASAAAMDFGHGLLRPGVTCAEVAARMTGFLAGRDLERYRRAGYGDAVGLSGPAEARDAALAVREDVETVLTPGMVISLAPMLSVPEAMPGAGGYRDQDVFVLTAGGADRLGACPCGPDVNIV